jgi:hypothetical protein
MRERRKKFSQMRNVSLNKSLLNVNKQVKRKEGSFIQCQTLIFISLEIENLVFRENKRKKEKKSRRK